MDFMSANTCAWHSIGNQCRKGYEGTHKFRSIANLGLGETVSRKSQPKEATSEPLEGWRAREMQLCVRTINPDSAEVPQDGVLYPILTLTIVQYLRFNFR